MLKEFKEYLEEQEKARKENKEMCAYAIKELTKIHKVLLDNTHYKKINNRLLAKVKSESRIYLQVNASFSLIRIYSQNHHADVYLSELTPDRAIEAVESQLTSYRKGENEVYDYDKEVQFFEAISSLIGKDKDLESLMFHGNWRR